MSQVRKCKLSGEPVMESGGKRDLVIKLFARDYELSLDQAYSIIMDSDTLLDELLEQYADEIQEAIEQQEAELDQEIKMNYDLYHGDIHGGI